ncbi:MAG: hypothetical protein HUK24_05055 [Sphaerochaetaceae bacterium]|nr:hypothetical protein [Sphaerochaetaceae bacterium]
MKENISQLKYNNTIVLKKLNSMLLDKELKGETVGAFVGEECDLSVLGQIINDYEDLALCVLKPDANKEKCNWLIALKGKYETVSFNIFRESLLPIIKGKGGGRSTLFQGIGEWSLDSANTFLEQFKAQVKDI